jgi:hypothetical protein
VRNVRADLVVEPMDWTLLSQHGDEWMGIWDRTVRGRGAAR